jgi:formylglycine-generating enzyme required for sulfatase activity
MTDALRIGVIFAILSLAGCATSLQKAQQRLNAGEILKARAYYFEEYQSQRDRASEPSWNGKRYEYYFSKQNTVVALVGLAETYRLTKDRNMTGYYVGLLNEFCLRHGMNMPEEELIAIEKFLGAEFKAANTKQDALPFETSTTPAKMKVPAANVAAGRDPARELGTAWTNSLGMIFLPVPGTKVMFCKWETRVQDFQSFAAATGRQNPKIEFEQTPTNPIVNVSWDDAQAFCKWLTEKETGKLMEGQHYRLPRDWEWSVAAELDERLEGTPQEKDCKIKDLYPWGTQWPPPPGSGNFQGEEASSNSQATIKGYRDDFVHTAPVGSFNANKHGLFDLMGNAWEWCGDFYNGENGSRVLRGGCWTGHAPFDLNPSRRVGIGANFSCSDFGFRVVLGLTSDE